MKSGQVWGVWALWWAGGQEEEGAEEAGNGLGSHDPRVLHWYTHPSLHTHLFVTEYPIIIPIIPPVLSFIPNVAIVSTNMPNTHTLRPPDVEFIAHHQQLLQHQNCITEHENEGFWHFVPDPKAGSGQRQDKPPIISRNRSGCKTRDAPCC